MRKAHAIRQEKQKLFGSAEERVKKLEKTAGMTEGYEEKQRLIQVRAMMQDEVSQMEEINKTIGTPSCSEK